jgi:uncharacterized membrane protein YheB (UPF0754 family)
MIKTLYRKILNYKRQFKQGMDTINIYDKKYRMDKYPDLPVLKIGIAVAGVTTVSMLGSYLFFRTHITNEGSRVAGAIAGSKDVKNSLKAIMEDPEILETSTKLINQIITKLNENPEAKQQIVSFLNDILNDIAIQNSLVTLAVNFFSRPEIENKLSELIIVVLTRQDVKDTINKLVDETCSHEPNREKLSEMIKSVLSNPDTKTGLVKLINSMI